MFLCQAFNKQKAERVKGRKCNDFLTPADGRNPAPIRSISFRPVRTLAPGLEDGVLHSKRKESAPYLHSRKRKYELTLYRSLPLGETTLHTQRS